MNQDTSGGQSPSRRAPGGRVQPGPVAAVLASIVLLPVAACGGGSPAAAPNARHGLPSAAMLDSFATCVRAHGVPNFYFSRNTHSAAGTPDNLLKIGRWAAPGSPNSAQFLAALQKCNGG